MKEMEDLYKVLSENTNHFPNVYLDQLYNEYFNMNWLRPETALYYFSLAKTMHKYMIYFEEPVLDLGCGDGTFLTIFFGGIFDKNTDCYRTVDLNKKDIYDNFVPSETKLVLYKPNEKLYGIDIRESVVKTARELKSYVEVKVADIKKIPYEDNFFKTVYCNIINDIKDKDLPKVFKEIYRVLDTNGFVIFTTPTEDFLDCLYYGKSIWKPRPLAFWEKFLKEFNFEFVKIEPFMDKRLLRFWDTGFRPYFKELMEFRKILQYKDLLLKVKSLYVEIFKNYLFDYINKPLGKDIGFALIIARKIQ